MVCLSCREFAASVVCRRCAGSLVGAPDGVLEGGLLVRSGWRHEGAARALVHRLKYDGVARAGAVLAEEMAGLVELPPGGPVTALVPLPRTVARRVRYGSDPGALLAAALSAITGIPVVRALAPAAVAPVRAGRARADRRPPRLRVRGPIPPGAVLVDDVVTTGISLGAAAALLGDRCRLAVTATSSPLGPR